MILGLEEGKSSMKFNSNKYVVTLDNKNVLNNTTYIICQINNLYILINKFADKCLIVD